MAHTQPVGPEKTSETGADKMNTERHVDVTMLGPVDAIKGVAWPLGRDGKREYSAWITEPCEVTIHVDNKQLRMKARPTLILSQVDGTVMSIDAPPASAKASMREKVKEVYGILTDWKVQPNKRMRETLDDFQNRDYKGGSSVRIVPDIRAASATLNERCTVSARFSSDSEGGWHIVMELQATSAEWDRVRREKVPGNKKAEDNHPATAPSKP